MTASTPAEWASAILTVDLEAVVANWRQLDDMTRSATCAAVVKADAYGLGAREVIPALAAAGCRSFFVATVDEALAARGLAPDADVHLLGGLMGGAAETLARHAIRPALNHLGEIAEWAALARRLDRALPAAIHIDTGMNRLGLGPDELDRLVDEPGRLGGIDIAFWMTHLACADEATHPMNEVQRTRFLDAMGRLPAAPGCLANSSGIFLGPGYHLGLARPGCALYGVNPVPGRTNPMRQTVRLMGRVLQVRDVDSPMTVGYGATHTATGPAKIATVAVGYADGYLRSASSRGKVVIGGFEVPVVGRVSMDMIGVDVSTLPEEFARAGAWAEIVGPSHPVDALAAEAGTIGYEILTSMGSRYRREYAPLSAGGRA